jgi:hypothetical protein
VGNEVELAQRLKLNFLSAVLTIPASIYVSLAFVEIHRVYRGVLFCKVIVPCMIPL